MPTVQERRATLEAVARENRDLHSIESTLAGFVLRRTAGIGMLKSWQSVILVLCAVGTVAASWYAALGH